MGTERSFLWLVSTTEVKSYQLPKRSEIEALATSFLQEIQSLAVVPPTGEKLSQILLSPVLNQLGNKRLVVVGDGILQTVPFAALPLTSASNSTSPDLSLTLSYEDRETDIYSVFSGGTEGGNSTSLDLSLTLSY